MVCIFLFSLFFLTDNYFIHLSLSMLVCTAAAFGLLSLIAFYLLVCFSAKLKTCGELSGIFPPLSV